MSARSTLLDRTSDLTSDVKGLTSDLKGRAEDARDLAADLYDRRDEAAELAQEASRRGQIQLWRALRALFGLLLVVPKLLLRAFSTGAEGLVAAVDGGERARKVVAPRAEQLAEQARAAADRVPSARSTRWRTRRRAVLLTVVAFAAGAGVGYTLARRVDELDIDELDEEPSVGDVTADAAATSPNGHLGAPATATADLAGEPDDRG